MNRPCNKNFCSYSYCVKISFSIIGFSWRKTKLVEELYENESDETSLDWQHLWIKLITNADWLVITFEVSACSPRTKNGNTLKNFTLISTNAVETDLFISESSATGHVLQSCLSKVFTVYFWNDFFIAIIGLNKRFWWLSKFQQLHFTKTVHELPLRSNFCNICFCPDFTILVPRALNQTSRIKDISQLSTVIANTYW